MITSSKYSKLSKFILKKIFGLDVDNLSDEFRQQQSKLEDAQKECAKLQDELMAEQIEDENKANAFRRLEEEFYNLRNELDICHRQLADLQSEYDMCKSNFAICESELASCKEAIEHYKHELSNKDKQLEALSRLSQNDSIEEDLEDKNKQIKILVEKLNDNEGTIQSLNETITILQSENTRLGKQIQEQTEEYKNKQESLITIILQKDDEISALKARVQALEALLNESTVMDAQSNKSEADTSDNVSDSDNPQDKKSTLPTVQSEKGTAIDNDEISTADLPTLTQSSSIVTKRSIERVENYFTNEIIEADDFFRQPNEVIMRISRRLEAIAKTNDTPYFLCANCHKPVKISKITTLRGESRFFTHCSNDVECEWRHQSESSSLPSVVIDESELKEYATGVSRYTKLKQLIVDTLTEQKRNENRISSILLDKVVKGNDFKHWRRPDISFLWNDKRVIIKLQRSSDGTRDLQDFDNFCKQNGIFIIWIFGCESGSQYQYLLGHNYQFTLFDNKTCAFIIDNEAEQECKRKGKLYFKCNWLDDNEHWHFTQSKTHSNGILVSLEDLIFEEGGNYKPYYKGLLEERLLTSDNIELKPSIFKFKDKASWRLFNKETGDISKEKYKDIFIGDDGRIHALTNDYPKSREGILNEHCEKTDTIKRPLNDQIYLVCNFEHWYLVSSDGVTLTKAYVNLILWVDNRLVAQDEDDFYIIDFHGEKISTRTYRSVRILNSNKAEVDDFEGIYYIDRNGNIIPDSVVWLKDGFKKVSHLGKWGLQNQKGTLIIPYSYDEIVSFRRRFYGFTNGDLIKLSNAPEYDYRIPFKATYKGRGAEGDYIFKFFGKKLFMKDNIFNDDKRSKEQNYNVYLLNIERNNEEEKLIIAAAPQNVYELQFSHVDKDSDFKLGEILMGRVTDVKPKKVYINFPDGRMTYITKNRIRKHGFEPNHYQKGTAIKLEKIGFEWFYESTIWRMLQ